MYNVLFVLNFSNSFEGSFIRSVKALSDEIENDSGNVVYLLPDESKDAEWISDLNSKKSPVYYFKNSLTGLYGNTKKISEIIKLWQAQKDRAISAVSSRIHTFFIAYPSSALNRFMA